MAARRRQAAPTREATVQELAEQMRSGALGSTEDIVRLLQSLRARADDLERDLIRNLQAFEISGLWQSLDSGSYENVLETYQICDAVRYRQGVMALRTVRQETLTVIGMPAAKQLTKVPAERREAAEEQLVNAATMQGRPVAERTARTIVRPFIDPAPVHRATRQMQELHQLRSENASLRGTIDTLRQRVTELEAQVESLSGVSRAPQGTRRVARHPPTREGRRSQPRA